MKKKILIFGAGAIGRGYIAPLLYKNNYNEISFVEKNIKLVKELRKKKYYTAAFTKKNRYEFIKVPFKRIFHVNDKINMRDYDLAFSCVGPKNCFTLKKFFKNAKILISCENDITTVDKLKKDTGNKNIYFGIPDVISSCSPPKKLKKIDTHLTISEQGELILEKGNYKMTSNIKQVNKKNLDMHWRCKLFIHNAAHAITAYLGSLNKSKYIHDAMNSRKISKVVHASIKEITEGVINAKYATKKFANYYKNRELKRFKNKLLFDTVSRVARDPLRKLSKDNRVVLSLKICLFNKKLPTNIAIGAKAALHYKNLKDTESQYLSKLIKLYGESETLERICGIEKLDPLNNFILSQNMNYFIKK